MTKDELLAEAARLLGMRVDPDAPFPDINACEHWLTAYEASKGTPDEAERRGADREREAIDAICVGLLRRTGGYDVDREGDGIALVRDAIAKRATPTTETGGER